MRTLDSFEVEQVSGGNIYNWVQEAKNGALAGTVLYGVSVFAGNPLDLKKIVSTCALTMAGFAAAGDTAKFLDSRVWG